MTEEWIHARREMKEFFDELGRKRLFLNLNIPLVQE
jgi:hypothetical protein